MEFQESLVNQVRMACLVVQGHLGKKYDGGCHLDFDVLYNVFIEMGEKLSLFH